MKIYISTDLEGISGIVNFLQTGRDEKGAEYERARRLLTAEVNAAVEGALSGGAGSVVVMDGHASGYNFIVEDLHPGGEYVTGGGRPGWMPGLDESFDAVLLLGYHAMAGTSPAILDHTQSSRTWHNYCINGVKTGEIGQTAIAAGHYRVPVVFQSGDKASCEEARALLGDIETVTVKEALSRTCAKIIPPEKSRKLISEGVKKAVGRIGEFKPFSVKLPAEVTIETQSTDGADAYQKAGWKRIDGVTVAKTAKTALDII